MFFFIFANGAVQFPCAILCSLSGGIHHSGDCYYLEWCFCFHGRVDVGTGLGGIGQSFLVSNRFSEVDPTLDQGVSCLTRALGMSSKGEGFWTEGGPWFWGLALWLEASANCHVASLCTVTGMAIVVNPVVCVWVDVVAIIGAVVVGMGWFRTLALYPLLAITLLFLLALAFGVGAFLTLGLELGWTGHDCVCCGQFCVDWVWDRGMGFGPRLPSISR